MNKTSDMLIFQQYVNIPTAATADETNINGKEEHLLLLPYQGK